MFPLKKKYKVMDCSMPNGPVCSACSDYEVCEAKDKVKGIKPKSDEEGEDDEDTNV